MNTILVIVRNMNTILVIVRNMNTILVIVRNMNTILDISPKSEIPESGFHKRTYSLLTL